MDCYVVNSGDFSISYWFDAACETTPMDSKNKLTIVAEKDYETVYVKVTGKAKEPKVIVKDGDEIVTDYTVTYVGNIKKGTAVVIVNGSGNTLVGGKTLTFKIK